MCGYTKTLYSFRDLAEKQWGNREILLFDIGQ